MVQSSLATKSHSFDLVRGEIENTIKQAETSLERFQENRESGEDLQNCVDFLNQLRGIFTLVELRGGTLLCQESVALANEVPVGATTDKNSLLTALSNALFTMRRYVEYYQRQQTDHPELLLPIINEVREARGDKPFQDSCFFEADPRLIPDCCADYDLRPLEAATDKDFEVHARRFRLMYQVGLLGLLQERNLDISLKLMARSAQSFARLCKGEPLAQFWCLLLTALNTMQDRELGAEKARKRLFMKAERYAREVVRVGRVAMGKTVPDSMLKDFVYILYRSGSANPEVRRILEACNLEPAIYNEHMMLAHRKQLYGPGADVLSSLAEALQEELNQLKDKLDIVERGIDPDIAELGLIAESLARLSNTLLILDLKKLAEVARQESIRLLGWEKAGTYPAEAELYSVADAVLNIEEAAQQLVTHGITPETDELAHRVRQDEHSLYLREALIVVTDEARAALTLAKRAITAFLESDFDKLHLANVPDTLLSIWGGMVLLEDEQAARVLLQVSTCIDEHLLNAPQPPQEPLLEALADALTSLEYYIEGMGLQDDRNPELLKLAETSLREAGL